MLLLLFLFPLSFFRKAQKVALAYEALHPSEIAVTIVPYESDAFHAQRIAILAKLGLPADHHRTCPIVSTYNPANVAEGAAPEPEAFLGGCDNTMANLIERFGAIPETKGPAWKV